MSRLRSNGDDLSVEDVLLRNLEPWINNPPSYHEMRQMYAEYGRLRAAIRRKQREIDRAEEAVVAEADRPRSNDAKKAKLAATSTLKDELAELEAQLAIVESEVKALEFMKTMFNAANYRTRLTVDIA